MEQIPHMLDAACVSYRRVCKTIPEKIRSDRLRIAVVGVIKSGKSTFVNSLLGKEMVKRGAGVITSITTRIQKGKKNQATLYFKSWDQINGQLQNALQHFPKDELLGIVPLPFDIRRKNDRTFLEKAYQKLIQNYPVTKDKIQPEILMIRHAVNGFDFCEKFVQADETYVSYNAREFEYHKYFTCDADKAFYVKDVCLDVYGKIIEPEIEIADCQGADSTDPSSLEQVLTYLDSANLIVYCISSRNGLRQADISFLNQIKKMGLLDHILFVNNCDLSEHDSLEDLKEIEAAIKQDLSFLDIKPQIYSFSCLYHLFSQNQSRLIKKDMGRLKLWQQETKMITYCDDQIQNFLTIFNRVIVNSRQQLLASNHVNRLVMILSKLDKRCDFFSELLDSDLPAKKAALNTLSGMSLNASRLELIVSNSIPGAISGLKDEIQKNIESVFKQDEMMLLKSAGDYIFQVFIDTESYRALSAESGFNHILYLMFQDFKRNLDLFVIENIKPKINQFVRIQENKIASHFQSLLNSYQIDVINSEIFTDVIEGKVDNHTEESIETVDIDRIKKILGLQLPGAVFKAEYTSAAKAGLLADFGLKTLSTIFSSILNKNKTFSFSPGLQKAGIRMKHQTQKQLQGQFESYETALQTQYFLPLIDAITREFKQIIEHRFDYYQSFEKEIENLLDLKIAQKEEQKHKVLDIKQSVGIISASLNCFLANFVKT
ncbi:MAG: dynamin family protein [Desulfobacula sp.]|nr:dynamin family protein [Desulfobacula sp.]